MSFSGVTQKSFEKNIVLDSRVKHENDNLYTRMTICIILYSSSHTFFTASNNCEYSVKAGNCG